MPDASQLMRPVAALAGRNISMAKGITSDEVEKLRDFGINTVGELWERTALSSDGLEGFSEVERVTGIDGSRLVELLPPLLRSDLREEVLYRSEMLGLTSQDQRISRPRASVSRLSKLCRGARWVRTHLLDLLLSAGACLTLLLLLRGCGLFKELPQPWGLDAPVVVTGDNLKKDQVLRPELMYLGRLPHAADYLLYAEGLEGLVLARDVARDKPLRHGDLLGLQVVAARDFAAGEIMRETDLRLEWSSYEPCALLRPADADGWTTRRVIRKGSVVGLESLGERPAGVVSLPSVRRSPCRPR